MSPRRLVRTTEREIPYDYLVVATGSRHSYFGHDEWEKLAPGLKSLEDAIEIRRRILMAFEFAEKTQDPAARAAAMNFVIIGGGPTGVEMAGAIAEIARETLAKDFRHIDPSTVARHPGRRRRACALRFPGGSLRERAEAIAGTRGSKCVTGVHADES